MKERSKALSILILCIVTLSSFALVGIKVSALAISPGQTSIVFSPGLQKNLSFTLFNNEHKCINVSIHVNDKDSSNIILNETEAHFNSNEEKKVIKYILILPENLEDLYNKEIKIIVSENEAPEYRNKKMTGVKVFTKIDLVHKIEIIIPEKYQNKSKIFSNNLYNNTAEEKEPQNASRNKSRDLNKTNNSVTNNNFGKSRLDKIKTRLKFIVILIKKFIHVVY